MMKSILTATAIVVAGSTAAFAGCNTSGSGFNESSVCKFTDDGVYVRFWHSDNDIEIKKQGQPGSLASGSNLFVVMDEAGIDLPEEWQEYILDAQGIVFDELSEPVDFTKKVVRPSNGNTILVLTTVDGDRWQFNPMRNHYRLRTADNWIVKAESLDELAETYPVPSNIKEELEAFADGLHNAELAEAAEEALAIWEELVEDHSLTFARLFLFNRLNDIDSPLTVGAAGTGDQAGGNDYILFLKDRETGDNAWAITMNDGEAGLGVANGAYSV